MEELKKGDLKTQDAKKLDAKNACVQRDDAKGDEEEA